MILVICVCSERLYILSFILYEIEIKNNYLNFMLIMFNKIVIYLIILMIFRRL